MYCNWQRYTGLIITMVLDISIYQILRLCLHFSWCRSCPLWCFDDRSYPRFRLCNQNLIMKCPNKQNWEMSFLKYQLVCWSPHGRLAPAGPNEKREKQVRSWTMAKSSCYYTVCVECCGLLSVGIMDCSIHWMAVESQHRDCCRVLTHILIQIHISHLREILLTKLEKYICHICTK